MIGGNCDDIGGFEFVLFVGKLRSQKVLDLGGASGGYHWECKSFHLEQYKLLTMFVETMNDEQQ